MISDVKSPRPPFSKGGRPLWLAISSSFPLLQRGMEACPPLVGGFSCVGATNIRVMSVYETINTNIGNAPGLFCQRKVQRQAAMLDFWKGSI